MNQTRTKITLSPALIAIIDGQPGTNGRAAKCVELIVEALTARGIECTLPPQRGKYARTKCNDTAQPAPDRRDP
jgi:hypothetical protein